MLGLAAAVPVAVYPFMKRITYWPQLFLGIAFNWGALLGWAAVEGSLPSAAPALCRRHRLDARLGTIYAHQDKEDDLLMASNRPRSIGAATPRWLALSSLWRCADPARRPARRSGLGLHHRHVAAAIHAIWQLRRLDITDPDAADAVPFQRDLGLLIFAGAVLDSLMKGGAIDDRRCHAGLQVADAADVLAVAGAFLEVEMRDGITEKLERSEDQDFGLRVLVGQGQAVVSTSRDDATSLRQVAERAVAMASAAPPDSFAGLAAAETVAASWPDLMLADAAAPDAASFTERARDAEQAGRDVPGVTRSNGASATASRRRILSSPAMALPAP